MTQHKMIHLKQRLTTGCVLLFFLFLLIYLSYSTFFRPVFAIITSAVIGISLHEYYRMADHKGYRPLAKLGLVCGIGYPIAVFAASHFSATTLIPSFFLGVSVLSGFLYFFLTRETSPMLRLAVTFFGILYISLPLSFIIPINYFFSEYDSQDGRWWLIYTLSVTKVVDIGAYFTGKLIGSRPLASQISPNKTFEGALGGLTAALTLSICMPWIASIISEAGSLQITLLESIVLGTIIGVLAQVGDLAESLLKRDAGIKDSNTLPGLGGMLDIIDSLVFTIPLVYFFLCVKEWIKNELFLNQVASQLQAVL